MHRSEWATVMHLNALLESVEQTLQSGREGAQQQGARGVAQDAAGLQAAYDDARGLEAWAAARSQPSIASMG